MTALVPRPRTPVLRGTTAARRPSLPALFTQQLGYALRDIWRTRIAFIFTFLFPLTFLAILGSLVGNEPASPESPVRLMQFLTPSAAVMGALYGAYPTLATSLSDARERGILKRLHGTPLPAWVFLTARVAAAALFALGSLTLMLMVGVVAYGVQIQGRTLAATAVTTLAAVSCFAAVGVAVAGLARSAAMAQALSIATAVALSFVSGVMGYGVMPRWADRVAQVFPLKPFNDSLRRQFDPLATGRGWDAGDLAVIGGWGVAALTLAVLTFRRDDTDVRAGRRSWAVRRQGEASAPRARRRWELTVEAAGRPGPAAMLRDQARWATVSALRDAGWVFFAIAMPVGLFVFNASIMDVSGQSRGSDLGLKSATGMIAWGAVVTVMVNVPEAIARARERGVLKRLRGTPLPDGTYFLGRFASALLLVLTTAALVLLAGVWLFDLSVAWSGVPLAAAVLALGTASLAGCGLLLVALMPSSKAVTAVGLGVTLPLAFFSDVFVVDGVPGWMERAGSLFPLKHLANSMSYALDPSSPVVDWLGLAVMSAWLVCSGVLATRFFRWSARS